MWRETYVALCILLCGIQRSKSHSMVDALCNDIVPEGYEIYKAPDEDGNPINVFIGFQVLDIGEVDEEKMVDQYKSQLPPVNYIKAMDIWLFVCILMVFSSLLMFALSYNIHTRECEECMAEKQTEEKYALFFTKRRKAQMYPLGTDEDGKIKFIQSANQKVQELDGKKCPKCAKKQYLGTRVDVACRTLFPGSFLIFAIVYWVHYLKIYRNYIS
ncbi:glycine receptor subunit alpha-2 [Trichonephila inaurata madagascariensis]|uniref:Glycine receptor subunit alpha-2 n=1 Tax=Trichonephila inaurata madagascariensis TaxID=2747483 RepID=A0A8X6XWE8_9ARAC|nr:glycine receptor subunit alpha-2 [Trichonephila inaurata madagascariensis]